MLRNKILPRNDQPVGDPEERLLNEIKQRDVRVLTFVLRYFNSIER